MWNGDSRFVVTSSLMKGLKNPLPQHVTSLAVVLGQSVRFANVVLFQRRRIVRLSNRCAKELIRNRLIPQYSVNHGANFDESSPDPAAKNIRHVPFYCRKAQSELVDTCRQGGNRLRKQRCS